MLSLFFKRKISEWRFSNSCRLFYYFILICLSLCTASCEWDYKEKAFIQIELTQIETIGDKQIALSAEVENIDLGSIRELGFTYSSTNTEPSIIDLVSAINLQRISINGTFRDTLDNLNLGTVYYIRPYILLENQDIFYGDLGVASTYAVQLVTDTVLIDFLTSSAEVFGIISGVVDGDEVLTDVLNHGHCWSAIEELPTLDCLNCEATQLGRREENGLFRSRLHSLDRDVEYKVRAYAIVGDTTIYGETRKFSVSSSWTKLSDFQGDERGFLAGFTINGKGYMGTGVRREIVGGLNTFYDDFYEFDPQTNSWRQMAPVPNTVDPSIKGRAFAVSFAIGDKGYLGTGSMEPVPNTDSIVYLNDFYEFDPVTNEWTDMDPFPRPVEGAFSFSIGDKGYVGSGDGLRPGGVVREFLNEFWEFDPRRPSGEQWKRKADFPGIPRVYAVGFSINGIGYTGTGLSQLEIIREPFLFFDFTAQKDFWAYDPVSDQWERKADVPLDERAFTAGFQLNNKGYVGLGTNPSIRAFKDFYAYDPLTNTWAQVEDFRVANGRAFSYGLNINNKGYVGMGLERQGITLNFNWLSDFWEFNP